MCSTGSYSRACSLPAAHSPHQRGHPGVDRQFTSIQSRYPRGGRVTALARPRRSRPHRRLEFGKKVELVSEGRPGVLNHSRLGHTKDPAVLHCCSSWKSWGFHPTTPYTGRASTSAPRSPLPCFSSSSSSPSSPPTRRVGLAGRLRPRRVQAPTCKSCAVTSKPVPTARATVLRAARRGRAAPPLR